MRRGWLLLVILMVATNACGGSTTMQSASEDAGPTDGLLAQIRDAPLTDGGTFDGTTTVGQDVAVWFWTPW